MTRISRLLLLVVVLCIGSLASCAVAADVPQGIVVIGWDGAQRDHLKEMIERNEVPVLMALSKEGTLVDVDVISGATDTKAGWTQILTGYRPEVTGVYSNSRFQPIPEGYSVFERLEKLFGDDNIETLAIVGKKGHVDNDPPVKIEYDKYLKMREAARAANRRAPGIAGVDPGKTIEENGVKYVMAPGKPWYIASQNMDFWTNGLNQNQAVGELALKKLDEVKGKRFFMFVHFAEPDHAGHAHGENSQEYTDAIKSDDEWTGKIIQRLKDHGIYDKTLVYVVVDHGFNEGTTGHSYAPYVFVGTNDKTFVRTQGAREDIAATVLKRFGVDLKAIQPALDGIPYDEPAPERKAPANKTGGQARPRAGAAAAPAAGAVAGGAAGGGQATRARAGARRGGRQQKANP